MLLSFTARIIVDEIKMTLKNPQDSKKLLFALQEDNTVEKNRSDVERKAKKYERRISSKKFRKLMEYNFSKASRFKPEGAKDLAYN
jgi:hypothetical protein